MHGRSRIFSGTLAALLLVNATIGAAAGTADSAGLEREPLAAGTQWVAPPPGGMLFYPLVLRVDVAGCEPASPPPRQRAADGPRPIRGLGWLHRYRGLDLERFDGVPFHYSLRSPLLSGLYARLPSHSCPPPTPKEHVSDEYCAELSWETGSAEGENRVEVPLPQLGARTARQLLVALKDQLERGEAVTLHTLEATEYEFLPGTVHALESRTCHPGD